MARTPENRGDAASPGPETPDGPDSVRYRVVSHCRDLAPYADQMHKKSNPLAMPLAGAVAVVALSLAGCAGSTSVPASSATDASPGGDAQSTSQSPTPTPSKTAALDGTTRPDQPFGGDCDQWVPPASALAIDAALVAHGQPDPMAVISSGPVGQVGALECTWGTYGDGSYLYAALVDASIVTDFASPNPCEDEGDGSQYCKISEHVGNYVVTMTLIEKGSAEAVAANLEDVSAIASSSIDRTEFVASQAIPESAWRSISCEHIDATSLFGVDSKQLELFPTYLADSESVNPVIDAAYDKSEVVSCNWYVNSDYSAILTVYPGEGWMEEYVARSGAAPIDVQGADRAFQLQPNGSQLGIAVFRGSNWFTFGTDWSKIDSTAVAAEVLQTFESSQ